MPLGIASTADPVAEQFKKASNEGHGAVHPTQGASQDAGAARVSRDAYHMALVARDPVRAI